MKEKNNLYRKFNNSKITTSLSGKDWSVTLLFFMMLGLVALFLYNYLVDPYHYFKNEFCGNLGWSSYYKARHILDNPNQYDCFIVGGSNSGAINPDLIEKYTGYKTYSYSFEMGNGYHYYDYVKFLVSTTKAQSIILHLSSSEVLVGEDYINSGDALKVPELVKGNTFKIIKDNISFGLRSVNLDRVEENNGTLQNGQVDWSKQIQVYNENPDKFIWERVLVNYDGSLENLGSAKLDDDIVNDNIECMKEIKKICLENNVELIVIMGPVFTSKRVRFEGNDYYDYLERLVDIVDIWDFSGFTDINSNPYNFYDYDHYNYNVADEMIKFMYGESELEQKFGVMLTKDNIVDYIQDRKRDLEEKKKEFLETETIEYKKYEDSSRIVGTDLE